MENRVVLTTREIEVLKFIAQGKSAKEIGNFMNLSERTVKAHKQAVMDTLNIHTFHGLINFVHQNPSAVSLTQEDIGKREPFPETGGELESQDLLILDMTLRGEGNEEISSQLNINISSVKNKLRIICNRYGCTTRFELMARIAPKKKEAVSA